MRSTIKTASPLTRQLIDCMDRRAKCHEPDLHEKHVTVELAYDNFVSGKDVAAIMTELQEVGRDDLFRRFFHIDPKYCRFDIDAKAMAGIEETSVFGF